MTTDDSKLHVPESLRVQLRGYRRRVWAIKVTEAVAICLFSIGIAYATVFVLDRLFDTPRPVRTLALVAAMLGCAVFPWFLHRWVWRRRTPSQLARLVAQRMPRLGDQLLGVIELAENQSEQTRSRRLVQAAIEQAANDAARSDLAPAAPASRRPLWGGLAASFLGLAVGLGIVFPAAAQNAWSRFLRPWGSTERYTFTAVEPIPKKLVVAHGEPFDFDVRLAAMSEWRPDDAEARIGRQRPVQATLEGDQYKFALPAQIGEDRLQIKVGDATRQVQVLPTVRSELVSLSARVRLPEYLGRVETVEKEVRGGAVAVVKGSRAVIEATASRPLKSATVDGADATPRGESFQIPETLVDDSTQKELAWQDTLGLSGADPLKLSILAMDDEPPTLVVENLPSQKVVLDSEVIQFSVRARDDYGVQRIGFEWRSLPFAYGPPVNDEQMLAAGDPYSETLDAKGVFSANSLGVSAQPLEVRVFVEDYFPERGRVYSAPHVLYVLTPDQHAIWITEELSKWHRQALEVRDREMQLYEENHTIRELSNEQLDLAETRQRIEKQAAAERSNGRQLRRLTAAGGDLLREAARNSEIGVGHIDRWASMLKVLDEISANRMPSVADLLTEFSDAPNVAQSQQPSAPQAGQNRDPRPGKPAAMDPSGKPKPAVPTIADGESSQRRPDEGGDDGEQPKKKPSAGKLTLPVTTVVGAAKKGGGDNPAGQILEQAVTEQRDLLEEFGKIADELNEVLANLEGSTLIKRLKAASRVQYQIAEGLGTHLPDSFGKSENSLSKETQESLGGTAKQQGENGVAVSYIMDDLHSYYERRRMVRFKQVLDEMREMQVLQGLRRVGVDITDKQGLAIAQSEFWSDSFDRWADDLFDPACSGSCPGGASPESLPPSIVLEAMRILEAEVGLREETRVAEQSESAVEYEQHVEEANRLSKSQNTLDERVAELSDRILELEDAEKHFGKELSLLAAVSQVMGEATGILAEPETGDRAIAAETEAIELLLQSKKLNPKGGGGGGSSPGGGGGGDTETPAIALAGRGVNENEVREDHQVTQVTGETGRVLPEEFRVGLDEYFSRLDGAGGSR
ncbi:hypothetical protein [Botrimarina mediterranea]|uniref:Uncharacterized protein n=1 Tax=Botrimarina mediterranea TaxID=2528022 RepID=A0A518KC94_9BACT|nr:hypothetical protein [Botrimarina mediterranea]QDV75416.1 hypothetical protein Spa11_36330 [Botrimarina mediterranea]